MTFCHFWSRKQARFTQLMLKRLIILFSFMVQAPHGTSHAASPSPAPFSPASLEILASSGYIEACVRVAEIYLFGGKKIQDFEKAKRFLFRAVNASNMEAIEILAGMYLNGRGVPQDEAMSARLYERCAIAGSGPCEFNLGIVYKNGGKNFPPNFVLAYYWLYKASINPELGDLRYDAAAYRNEVGASLDQKTRMHIFERIYSH